MESDYYYISLCKKKIAEELNLKSDSLMQRDFEYLSKFIFEKSSIDLSTATLRRLWSDEQGRLPQAKTLDALAQTLEYSGWHEFKKAYPLTGKTSGKRLAGKFYWVAALFLILIGTSSWYIWSIPSDINLHLKPEKLTHDGVPATIGFYYDISEARDNEVKIQLSWNPNEQAILDPSKDFYTGTYFYPDYHQAKLLLGEQILAHSNIHITSSGWHGLIMKSGLDPRPIFIDSKDYLFDDRIAIGRELYDQYPLDQQKEIISVFTLSNASLAGVNGDSFTLKTAFKGLGYLSDPACAQVDLVIKGDTGAMRIPISSMGCYGLTELKCGDVRLSGKTSDLSSLSVDLLQSQTLSLKTGSNQLTVVVGNNQPFGTSYSKPIGSLRVIKFIFTGYGEVTQFEIQDVNGLVKDPGSKPLL